MKINRLMIAAPASGSGKTLLTCGLLRLLTRKNIRPASFKCGPDFIDPMFHSKVLGTRSRNMDTFFTGESVTRYLLEKNAADCDAAVMEGVMGYYDGLSMESSRAGASDLASVTDTPVFLLIPAKGASRSLLPMIKGFLDFQKKPCIRGIILNRVNGMLYPRLKEMIEKELHIPVVGYFPVVKDCVLESRHLGLILPEEIQSLQKKLDSLADILEKTLDLRQILEIAENAPELDAAADAEVWNRQKQEALALVPEETLRRPDGGKLRIGLARDEAFCFFYEDNLQLLRDLGAELEEFSPLHDRHLPDGLDALLLHGGYPELHAEELEGNSSMRRDVREAAVDRKLPVMAECGGFLYLHESLKDMEGKVRKMAGVFPESSYYTGHLNRFGYMTLKGGTLFGHPVGEIRSHEFHYYESENPGDTFRAEKPSGTRSWRCIRSSDSVSAGFPHLYYYANPEIPVRLLQAAGVFAGRRET